MIHYRLTGESVASENARRDEAAGGFGVST
jgi:hypothetical protein